MGVRTVGKRDRDPVSTTAAHGDRDGEPVELRVHGVGGSAPEALLGAGSPDDVVRVGGGPRSAFYRRRTDPDRRSDWKVEGYCWGELTTRSTFQPLWLLLLPFTLLNVAGWLHRSPRSTRVVGMLRHLVGVIGFTLTATWVLWLTLIVLEQGAWGWLGSVTGWPPLVRFGLGCVASLALFVVGVLVARHTTGEYEAVPPPPEARPLGADESGLRLGLGDPAFWHQRARPDGAGAARMWIDRQINVHTAVAAVTFLVAAGRGLLTLMGDGTPADLGIGRLMVPVLALQLLLLLILAACSLLDSRATPGVRRLVGPFTAAGLAVGISHAAFGGMSTWLGGFLGLEGVPTRPEHALADVLGLAAIGLVLGALILAVWHVVVRAESGQGQRLRVNGQDPALPLDGLPNNSWKRRVRRRRKLALVLSRIGWMLVPPTVLFVGLGTLKLLPRAGGRAAGMDDLWLGTLTSEACTGGLAGSFLQWLTTACGGLGTGPTWLASAGTWIAALVVTGGPAFLFKAARSPHTRANVGVLWDILTFWPRWHHPLAVRSYAERAVPELQHRIVHHARTRRVVLSVHSQGSVLAHAAVAALPRNITRQVSMVSFGCPLTTLYSRFFPAYFPAPGTSTSRGLQGGDWTNFYRLTDYVGQEVAGVPSTLLPDPAEADHDLPDVHERWLDEQPRVPWTVFASHSHYRQERPVQDAVRARTGVPPS